MDKQILLEKLAVYHGLITEYTDSNGNVIRSSVREYLEFLDILGINTENTENLAEELERCEYEEWSRIISPEQIVKHGEAPLITLRLPDNKLNKTFNWILQEENGKEHHGEFHVSHFKILESKTLKGQGFHKIDISLPILIGIGYHKLKIKSETGKEADMRLIIAPQKCYQPFAIEKKEKINGFKFSLFKDNSHSDYRISSYVDLKKTANYAATEEEGIIRVDALNKFFLNGDEPSLEIPSSRIMFNTLLVDVDESLKFVEDGDIKLKILTEEFQEELKRIQESEDISFKAIYELKTKIFRIIYNSFRENHITKNTNKSRDFFNYLTLRGECLRKSALFEAIREYLTGEDPKLSCWQEWPEGYKNPNSEAVRLFEKKNIESIQFFEFLQWQADIQLSIAGKMSLINKLAVGICPNLPFFTNTDGSETWLKQEYYAFNSEAEEGHPPVIPSKINLEGYKYVSQILIPNMLHSGAIKLEDIYRLENQLWTSKQNSDISFYVKYPLEDFFSIIALESHRNKCLVVVDEMEENHSYIKQLVENYGFLYESDFNIREINDDELPSLFEKVNLTQKQSAEDAEYGHRIELERTPLSVYRFQFNKDFTFKDAQAVVPYLKELGISHCYASPLLRARQGSMHGYDIINHSELNPEIGTLNEFYEFVDTLHHHDMGLILDIVPNHMGVGKENFWWIDVLENGQASVYASFFDINWEPIKKELQGKVLVPVLGDHYGNILESGQFKFHFDKETGKLRLNYWDHEFPINPSSYPSFMEHRIEVLESRLGGNSPEFHEYQSIITVLKKIPGINETSAEKIAERNREKDIAHRRLAVLCIKSPAIEGFINENIIDFQGTPNDPISCNRLHSLLEQQAYRLSYWRVSIDVINYRRFFDVNDLIGIRTENPLVFSSTHSLILDLIEQEKIDGLRIDHPDGLSNPCEYFKDLQIATGKRLGINFDSSEEKLLGSDQLPIFVVIEKILAPFEKIPKNWAVSGTVGYEFLNEVCNLFVDSKNDKKFTRIYQRFIGKAQDFNELVIECKKLIMKTSLTGELTTLSTLLNRISEKYYSTRDYTLNSFRDALSEVIACFPVYRTYISEDHKGDKAIDYIKWAIGMAKKRAMYTDPSIFDFMEKVLLAEWEEDKDSAEYAEILNFAKKFQQYTAPLMAKGMEDTSFYRYNKLISLNEVGGEPSKFGVSTQEFHNDNIARLERMPQSFLTTSTHDTKRSEDVRARICVLSEIPEKWQEKLNKFSRLNKSRKSNIDNVLSPDRNDEYLFYQTLIGIWDEHIDREELIQRLEEYMIKALRESKSHTSWVNINDQYEAAMCEFIRKIISSPDNHPFWKEFIPFQKSIASAGYLNALSQCALKLTCPGIPDIYQGSELFKFTLVDPDNRKPVNYDALRQKLEEVKYSNPEELLPFESGKMKLFLTSKLLNFRQKHENIFRKGGYTPLEVEGMKKLNLVAFARSFDDEAIIIIVPKLVYDMVLDENPLPVGEKDWEDTSIELPAGYADYNWKNILSGQEFNFSNSHPNVKDILTKLPVAVLYAKLKI